MITYALNISRSQFAGVVSLLAGLLLLSMTALGAQVDGAERLTLNTEMKRIDRDNGVTGHTSEQAHDKLVTAGKRTSSPRAMALTTGQQTANNDFWFYTADVELFNDLDRDGYYHGIDLLFDADTYYAFADVYAVVYLSQDGGPWNEYAVTEDFTLFGASSDDEYVIVTELVSGYPSGSYDILIELFDADNDAFLAWYGPEDTSELAFLPLEDVGRDQADTPDVIVVNNRGGGGASGLAFTLILGLLALLRLARRARSA